MGVERQLSFDADCPQLRGRCAASAVGPPSSHAPPLPTCVLSVVDFARVWQIARCRSRTASRPTGEIIATPHRGLHDGQPRWLLPSARPDARKRAAGRARQWIACVLEFKGRHRRATDAAQPLHRAVLPRRGDRARRRAIAPASSAAARDAEHFADAVGAWRTDCRSRPRAGEMDDGPAARARRCRAGAKRTIIAASLPALPDGAFVLARRERDLRRRPISLRQISLLAWSPAGYGNATRLNRRRQVEVLTPPSIVAVLSAGYRPMLHPSGRTELTHRRVRRGRQNRHDPLDTQADAARASMRCSALVLGHFAGRQVRRSHAPGHRRHRLRGPAKGRLRISCATCRC